MVIKSIKDEAGDERPPGSSLRFYVLAPSVSAVRRALHRAPGGAQVIGRYDRRTIECAHTMDAHSFGRHWPVIVSRLEKHDLTVVERPGTSEAGTSARPAP
jgi:hypothetical protein